MIFLNVRTTWRLCLCPGINNVNDDWEEVQIADMGIRRTLGSEKRFRYLTQQCRIPCGERPRESNAKVEQTTAQSLSGVVLFDRRHNSLPQIPAQGQSIVQGSQCSTGIIALSLPSWIVRASL